MCDKPNYAETGQIKHIDHCNYCQCYYCETECEKHCGNCGAAEIMTNCDGWDDNNTIENVCTA